MAAFTKPLDAGSLLDEMVAARKAGVVVNKLVCAQDIKGAALLLQNNDESNIHVDESLPNGCWYFRVTKLGDDRKVTDEPAGTWPTEV